MKNNPIFDLSVEGNQIKPLSPTFAKVGGKSHANGGTDVTLLATGETVEAQKNEPISKQFSGEVVAWGKMKNPHTGNTFEKDANILSTLENRVTKLNVKGQKVGEESSNTLAQSTSSVLMDAALTRDIDTTMKKEIYAKTQQDILDVSEVVNLDPKKIANNMAKNGATLGKVKVKIKKLPTAADGKTFKTFKQYEDPLQKVIEDNQQYLVTDYVQPRNTLYNQPTNGNSFGDAYNSSFDVFNQIQSTWGLPLYDNTTPQGVERYQNEYNQNFNTRIGSNYYAGNDDPLGVDGKYGNKTSSQNPFRDRYKGLQNKTLTASDISKMTDDEFRQVSNMSKAEFAKQNPNLSGVWEYDFRAPIQALETSTPKGSPIPIARPVATPITYPGNVVPQTAQTQATPTEALQRSSLADRNRNGVMQFLPEISAILDQPDFVQRQEYRPQYIQDYQVSFQDRINQGQADFNRAQLAYADNPLALSTMMGEKRRADNQILAEEFRTNQGISNNVANQNIKTNNQAQMQNLQLADQQYMRQEQARANTEAGRQKALQSISSKVQQRQQENNAIRLIENMSNFRTDENYNVVNQNGAKSFITAKGEVIALTPEELAKYNAEQNKKNKNTKQYGGFFRK